MAQSDGGSRNRLASWIGFMKANYLVLLIFVLVVYWPRLLLSYMVFVLAQLLRLLAKVFGIQCGRPVANRRILLITDYLPPQTHGIAIRCQAYAKEMRAQGHYVAVFATAYDAAKETSFDHPNIPSVPNPFNLKNRIGYTAGVKLAWYLGAYTWDTVHLVYPSLIGGFVLSCCSWRGIPTYCSHHVEMEMFSKHAPAPLDKIGLLLYDVICKAPALRMATLNAAPTLCFARAHCGAQQEDRLRRVPSGTHDVFSAKHEGEGERTEVRRSVFGVSDEGTPIVLMVQRLSKEKGTELVFPVFAPRAAGGGGVEGVLAIAGDGPSRSALESEARKRQIPVVFLGNVPHDDLPKLYRAADCFVTMSLSETFGLTCLEAQMCGCPAVMPHCEVFDEIWGHRVPTAWRYNVESTEELSLAIAAAVARGEGGGRLFLEANPVRQTWADASAELLSHYEECIQLNRLATSQKKSMGDIMTHWMRVVGVLFVAALVSNRYFAAIKAFGMALEKSGFGLP